MKKLAFRTDSTSIIISVILILAAVLRFWGLTNQSMWVDELITMSEVDPHISWGSMFDLLDIADPHPPLFFILERITCSIFGYTEGVAKGLNALIGSISVLFIYYLGKEILNKKLGIVAAILLCFNYYSLYYSQEGRDYALALCTSILANLFFVRLLKNPGYKSACLYGFFSLLLLYTHYFGLFIVAGHGFLVFALMFSKSSVDKANYRYFFSAAAVIIVGYLPWMPSFLKQLKITSFWIPPIPQSFATSYFFEYFGNATILEPVLVLILLFYCLQVYSNHQHAETKSIVDDPLSLSFCVIFFTVFCTFYIPYIRSVWVVPMLQSRYTIVIVPAFVMAIAYGLILIKSDHIRISILVGIVVLTSVNLVFTRKFYSTEPTKTQFREATQFMQQVGGAYPLIESGSTIWPHGYYLHHYRYDLPVFWGLDKVDSVLHSPFSKYHVDGFWLFGAFPDESHLTPEVQRQVDSAFTVVQSKTFFQSWAELYVRKTGSWKTIFVSPYDLGKNVSRQFSPEIELVDLLQSKPVLLKPGKYQLLIEQSGKGVNGEPPRVSLSINDRKIGDIICSENGGEQGLTFTVESTETAPIKLQLINPLSGADGKRRAYIRFIRIIPFTELGKPLTPDNNDVTRYLPAAVYHSNERVIPIWNSSIISGAIKLKPGRYRLSIIHMGTKAAGVYPHINVLINEKNIGDFITNKSLSESHFQFEIKSGESEATIKLDFDNDLMANGEDRNAFIKSVFIVPSE